MDILQGLIETGNTNRLGWRIVNNNGTFGVFNNRTSNVLFSILNNGAIGTSSSTPADFINSYSNLNIITNYTGGSSGTIISSQWTTLGTKIYYNTSNVGIGTTDPVAPLHIYNTSNARLLLDTATTGTAAVEFRRGTGADMQNDYRFINDTDGTIKLQFENNTQAFSNLSANLAWFSSNETIIHNNTTINGRVGIGTTYHTTRALDVLGNANVSGIVSAGGLNVSGSASSNVVITNSLTNNTTLVIQNGFVPIISIPAEISVVGTASTTIGSFDRVIIFPYSGSGITKDYTFTITENLECDILIVGGGGSGSQAHGGGGGAGAVIFMKSVNMNGSYTIKIGKGGVCGNNGANGLGGKGNDTEIFKTDNIANKIVAEGGGGGGQFANANGGNGGSGGGGDAYNVNAGVGGSATAYTPILDGATGIKYGNNGGTALGNPGHGGGGGGAGGVGEDATGAYNTGNNEAERAHGGIGIKSATINAINYDFKTLFGTNAGAGVLEADGFIYFGGGGGNGRWKAPSNNGEGGNGGLGGGGKGGWGGSGASSVPLNGLGYPGINGSGGGGGGGADYTPVGGDGGSGIVIIRYRKTTFTSSSIELVRGTATDTNRDYKVGNYGAEFKVISSTSGVDTDYIKITTSGAIFNPTGTASWNTGSDRRIKENIERASYDKCYDNINKLELNRFNYVEGFNTVSRDNKQLGFIAQEVYDIFPKAISSHRYYSDTLNIPDLLSIDVSQINYSLYGAVKKLIEINNEKDKRIKTLGYQLKTLETLLNISIDTSSNIALDTSNIALDTSNIALDTSSNIALDTSSNIALDTSSNIALDTSNIALDTSNIIIDTSNIVIDTSNIALDTSNIIIDTSNISIDTSNIIIDTSNISIDTSNISIDTSNSS